MTAKLSLTNPRLMTGDQFRARYNVGRTKFYALLKSGKLRAVKLGTRLLVEEEEAERFKAELPSYRPQHRPD